MPIRKRALAALLCSAAALLAMVTSPALAGAAPYTGGTSISVTNANPTGCDKITLHGTGFGANELVDVTLHTAPQLLATVRANPAGHITVKFGFPSGVTGSHTIVATGETTGKTASVDITIRACSGTNGTGGGGSPASTGVAVFAISALGVVLLVAGGLFLLSARRRRALV